MQLSVEDLMDVIRNAVDNVEVGDPNAGLTVQELEQIASVCARKPVTFDPQDLAQAQQDWQAANAPQPAQPQNAPGPGWTSPGAPLTPAQQQAQAARATMGSVVAREPPAPPPERGPEFSMTRGRRSSFDEDLEKMLKDAGQG